MVTTQVVGAPGSKGLKSGALGLASTVVIGVSSTAPAYSMAATLGLVVAIAGIHAPGVLIVSFVPMLFIAYAFRELNRVEPDCGTTFTWATRAFGPYVGWMGGWGIIAADVVVMSSLSQIAGRYFFLLFGADDLAANAAWVTSVGVVFIALMTWVCYRGIEISARVQLGLLGVELLALAIFAVVALVKVYTGHALASAGHPTVAWLNPFTGSMSDLSDAFLLAVFIYWGWDCAVSVNEETRDTTRTPGRAAVISTVVLVTIFAVVSVAALAFAGPDFLAGHSGDVLGALSQAVLGSTAGKILVLCVLTSAAASTQTTILPTARATLAMAAHRALPLRFAQMHPRYLTPTFSTLAMGGVSAVFYVGLTIVSTNVLQDSAAAVGLLIAFYYGLTGFACTWFFRRQLRGSAADLWFKGVLPMLGGLILLGAFVLSVRSYLPESSGASSLLGLGGIFVIGAGSLLLGLVLMLAMRFWAPEFFRRRSDRAEPYGRTMQQPLLPAERSSS
jgi:amino acid transporter